MMVQGILFGFLLSFVGLTMDERGAELTAVVSVLFILVGIIMLTGAAKFIFQEEEDDKPPPAWLEKIEYLRPREAFSTGFGWLMVSPKQWAFVLTAVAVIFTANLNPIASLVNFFVFSVLIQLFYLLIIGIYLLMPKRSGVASIDYSTGLRQLQAGSDRFICWFRLILSYQRIIRVDCMNDNAPFELLTMPESRPENAPDYFHVMAKPTGAICNLDCEYCFFLSKEALYPGSPFRMKDDVLEAYIRHLIESQNAPQVTIAWQGGEPTLMGLDFFQQAMAVGGENARPGVTIDHTIQTNGTKLDDEWCRFFKKHNFLVGLSLDGPKHMHDAYRVDKRGDGTFDQVMAAARLLQQHNVDFNILCTVHAANGDHPLEVTVSSGMKSKPTSSSSSPLSSAPRRTAASRQPGLGRPEPAHFDELEKLPVAKSSKRPLYILEGSLVTERSV